MGSLVDVTDSVLVVVDVQPSFLDKLGAGADPIVERIAWLVRLASTVGVPIVATEERPGENGTTAEGIACWLPQDVTPHDKPIFGLAACTPIMADLERHGRRTAVLCGLETDVCVSQSALGLLDAGWRVVVVSDAVACPGDAHEQGLARMRDAGVTLIGLKGLCYEWLRTVEDSYRLDERLWATVPAGITF
jgi:nicotinamidase-related amidase